MPVPNRVLPILALAAILASCANHACDEFAAPHDRDPKECASKPTASQRVPQDPNQPDQNAPRYCYSSLGQEECYDKPQPGHETGYLGTYSPGPDQPPKSTSAPPSSP